ncbi:hypothetical protein [Luteibacter sp. dw_328]|uniref:hypothetical protein n=1 Tax=Luteibacter sp. dw_328 TaxID=2719796 RepID=UPI001BD3580B|nr:hypothetical protein [Luteibacter sp. dw_328]
MTLHFVAAHGSAVDSANGLVIYPPRMEQSSKPDEVEYQYAIYNKDRNRHGLGFFGLNVLTEEAGETVRLNTLDLGGPQVIDSMLKLKQRLHIDGDDFEFIHRLAEGLVRVFESRTDNTEAVHYVALTEEAPLQDIGLAVPANLSRRSNGQVVLAEAWVDAHPIVRSVP